MSHHINYIVPTLATRRATAIARTQLEMHQSLFVHASILILISSVVIVSIATEVLRRIIVCGGGTLLEPDGITRYPAEVLVALEGTCLREQRTSDGRGGRDGRINGEFLGCCHGSCNC